MDVRMEDFIGGEGKRRNENKNIFGSKEKRDFVDCF